MRYRFEPAHPFNFDRLYGNEKYSLQNMLLKEANMPTEMTLDDQAWEIWSDRIHSEWQAAWPLLKTEGHADATFNRCADADFLAFASKVVSLVNNREVQVTGAVVVRFTNATSGYPTYRLTATVAKEISNRRYGVPIIQEESRSRTKFDVFGGSYNEQHGRDDED